MATASVSTNKTIGNSKPRHPGGRPTREQAALKKALAQVVNKTREEVLQEFEGLLVEGLIEGTKNIRRLGNGYTKAEMEDVGALPSLEANKYLVDRLLGKPTERVEGRGEVTIKIVYEKRPRIVDGKVHEEGA